MEDGKTPRYKLYKPRPYDDADYYWANSFDKNIWYIHFGDTYNIKNPIKKIIGTENAINNLIKLNENVNPRMIHNYGGKYMRILTLIKKYLYKTFIKKNLDTIKDENLIKLYNLYDYTFLDEELSEISREIRVRQVKNMLDNNINEFMYHFGDFKTADMWINMPWRLEKYEKIC